jgi:hypothetical protein
LSIFHRAYIGHQPDRRLPAAASIIIIAALSAALWAICIAAGMALWSMF